MKKLYGVIAAMTTPFDENGAPDLNALAAQTEFLIGAGVNCLYPCGTTGEMFHMTAEEREAVAETVIRTAAGRVTVYIHTGAMREEETVRLSKHAYAVGADGVGIVTPTYFTMNRRATVAYYQRICGALPKDFPVYVYVIPQLAGNDVPAEWMEEIAETCANVVGVKYSFADMRRILAYTRVRGGDFSVVVGPDDLFLPCLAAGCSGTVSGCSSAVPEPFVAVYRAFLRGDLAAAREAQRTANEVVKILGGGSDLSIFKNVQILRGVPGGHVRRPLLDLPPEAVDELKTAIAPYLPR